MAYDLPMDDACGWAVSPDNDFKRGRNDKGPFLEFGFGSACSCWVRLDLTADEDLSLDAGDGSVRAFIKQVHQNEPRYRTRMYPV